MKIRRGSPEKLGRPTVKPHEVKERFSAFLRSECEMNDPLLFTPGPLTTSATVKAAMQRDLGSRDTEFIKLVAGIRRELLRHRRRLAENSGYEAVLMQGSGTFGIESVLSSVIPPEGTTVDPGERRLWRTDGCKSRNG